MPRPRPLWKGLQALVTQELQQVGDAAGVAPLVVVPGHDLDEVADAEGVHGGESGRVRIALQVGRNSYAGSNSKPSLSASTLVSPMAALTICASSGPYSSS